jgi:hypothetical protein
MAEPQTIQAADPKAAFALLYPRLRLVNACDEFEEITVDGAAADLIEAGLFTQEMLDALPPCGRKNFYLYEGFSSSVVSKVKAGIRIKLWGKGFQMEALREKLGIKPIEAAESGGIDRAPSLLNTRCPPELQAARQRALVSLGKLAEFADSFPKQVAAEIMRRVLSLEELLRRETERRAPQVKPARPAYLRLVSSTMRE